MTDEVLETSSAVFRANGTQTGKMAIVILHLTRPIITHTISFSITEFILQQKKCGSELMTALGLHRCYHYTPPPTRNWSERLKWPKAGSVNCSICIRRNAFYLFI